MFPCLGLVFIPALPYVSRGRPRHPRLFDAGGGSSGKGVTPRRHHDQGHRHDDHGGDNNCIRNTCNTSNIIQPRNIILFCVCERENVSTTSHSCAEGRFSMFVSVIFLPSNWHILDVFASLVRHHGTLQLLQPQQPEGGTFRNSHFRARPALRPPSLALISHCEPNPLPSLPVVCQTPQGHAFHPMLFLQRISFRLCPKHLNTLQIPLLERTNAFYHLLLTPSHYTQPPRGGACLSLLGVSQHTNLMSRRSSPPGRDTSFHNTHGPGGWCRGGNLAVSCHAEN